MNIVFCILSFFGFNIVLKPWDLNRQMHLRVNFIFAVYWIKSLCKFLLKPH